MQDKVRLELARSIVGLASDLIRVPSVNPMQPGIDGRDCELSMALAVRKWFERLDVETEIIHSSTGRPSIIAWLPGTPGLGMWVLDAHLDTVPAGDWSDAFEPRQVEDRLIGRGACDVKGPMATMLITFERLAQLPFESRPSLLFVGSADEEFGQAGVMAIVEAWQQNPERFTRSRTLKGVIVAEPTELNPVVAHHGVLRWTVSTKGLAAHSSLPELGQSAIYEMAPVIEHWRDYAQRLQHSDRVHPLCGGPRTSIGMIRGGSAVNIVPDRCEIEIDRRVAPTETLDSAWKEVTAEMLSVKVMQLRFTEPWTISAPLTDEINHPLGEALARISNALGCGSGLIGVSFGTHAPRYQSLGAPVVVYGPGSIAQAHTHGEWVSVSQLATACEVLFRLLTEE